MIRINVTSEGHETAVAAMDRLAAMDLRPLAESIRTRMVEGNHRGLDEGTDAHGNRLADLAESTLADPRRGEGGPMIPHAGRRFIDGFTAEITPLGDDGYLITGEWDPIARFHRTSARQGRGPASGRRPARDIVGIRPADWDLIATDVRSFAEDMVRF
jgi:hypothetical protein